MRTIIMLIVLLMPFQGYTQWYETKKINGEIIEENLNPSFISFSLPFISFEATSPNVNLFADAGLDAKFGKFILGAKYRYNYADDISGQAFNYFSVYEPEDSRCFNLKLGYIFDTEIVRKSIEFDLKTVGNTSYIAVATVPKTKFKSFQIGLQNGFSFYAGVLKDFKYNAVFGSDIYYEPVSHKTTTYLTYNTLSIGFVSGHYGYWKAKLENYGEREAQQMNFRYVNLLVMTHAHLDDIALYKRVDEDYFFQQVSLRNTKFSRFGICFGYQSQDFNKFGFGGKMELGYYPGVKGNFFGHLGLNFTSNFQISKLFK